MADLIEMQSHAQTIHEVYRYTQDDDFPNQSIEDINDQLKALRTAWMGFLRNHNELVEQYRAENRPDQVNARQDHCAQRLGDHQRARNALLRRLEEIRQQEEPVQSDSENDSARNAASNATGSNYSDQPSNESVRNSLSSATGNNQRPIEYRRQREPEISSQTRNSKNATPNQWEMFATLMQRMAVRVAHKKENTWGYDGNLSKWQGFHDSFKSAVHDDDLIEPVYKFRLLKSSLRGKAAEQLGEWPLSSTNYYEAWEWLKEQNERPYQTSQQI